MARLSVPAHAERAPRAGTGGIADAGGDHRRYEGRRAHRRPGSYSIDQQRYNGQFGGQIFWEIKNGKKTRPVTNVTYNAITTDFWGNLDAVTARNMAAVRHGGDAKGQPTQTQNVSHGSPWARIRKIMVGAAFQ